MRMTTLSHIKSVNRAFRNLFTREGKGLAGEFDSAIMVQEPGNLFAASVEQAVRRWRFQPGTRGGEAVPARVRQRIDFTLD